MVKSMMNGAVKNQIIFARRISRVRAPSLNHFMNVIQVLFKAEHLIS